MDKNYALNYDYDEKADVLYVSLGEPYNTPQKLGTILRWIFTCHL